MSQLWLPALAFLFVGGCQPTYSQFSSEDEKDDTSSPQDTGQAQDTEDEEDDVDDEYWSATSLVVLSPESGAFLPLGEQAAFTAEVQDADGQAVDFDDIEWGSDVDDAWAQRASSFEDSSLGVGTHTLTAQAALPNGDRLAYAVGGVLVQSAYAGTFTGTIQIDATLSDYTFSCSGAATIVVDQEGEVVEGESECLLSLSGYDLDLSLDIDAENTEGEVEGSASATLYSFEVSGSVTDDGVLELSFTDSLFGYIDMEGEISAERITREVTEL